jgi:PKD repeat protein
MRTEDAFVVAVSKSRAKEAHGRWIPVDYWLEKVKYILFESDIAIKMTPKKLTTRLEKRGFLDRVFNLPADKESFGIIVRIHSNNSKVQLTVDDSNGGTTTKEKTIYFLFLETDKLKPPSWSTLKMWQKYYDDFINKRQTHQLRVDRWKQLSVIVEESSTMASPAARAVTPTELTATATATPPLDNDLKAILEPFFVELGSFKGDNIGLRKAIQAFGCQQQWINNEVVAKAKRDDEDLTALNTVQSHSAFLDRYCCPPRKSCIQSFIALATMIDKEEPAVDIFQLQKHGGSKGTGNKLVPIIPTTEPRYYNDNAKQWLPRVLDASIAVETNQYDSCFLLLKACKKLNPRKAFDDLVRVSTKRSRFFGKMDIHRQISMAEDTNITYGQMRMMRPFFIADSSCTNPLHSEHAVHAVELHSSHKPVFIDFKEDQYKRNGWYLPVDKVIKDWLESLVENSSSSSTLHVILSADHGQGHWKANIACLLIDNSNRVVKETNTVIASVECRKDKRQVLIDCGVPAKSD